MSSTVQVYRDHAGRWRWRRVSSNGRETARSQRAYRWRWYVRFRARRMFPGDVVVETDR